MNFSRLILLNILRHRVRSLIGSAGIAFGVAAMLTVLSIVLGAIGMFEKIDAEGYVVGCDRNSVVPANVFA